MPAVTTIVDLDGVQIESAGVMNRDCSFAINDMRPFAPNDDVVRNFPIAIASWEDSTIAPAINSETIVIDHTAQSDDCDSPTVSTNLGSCYVTAPNMAEYDLSTAIMELLKLIPEFCKQRNIVPNQQLRSLLNSNGSINMGNPYASHYMRWAYSGIAKALHLWVTDDAVAGDSALAQSRMDGLYTQIDAGWDDAGGGDACTDALNVGQTINWGDLCGTPGGPQSPDSTTVAGKTVTLWGASYDVPVGMNLAELLDWMWFTKVRRNFTSLYGDVLFEAHMPFGAADTLAQTVACIQPCSVSGDFDLALRERLEGFIRNRLVRFHPHGEVMPLMESRYIAANTMRIGPRTIGGNPTYGLFFKNMNQYWNELYPFGETYGGGFGLNINEPLLSQVQSTLAIEALDELAFHYDFNKISHKCVTYSALAKVGVLAVSRHLWLNITHVAYQTWVTTPTHILSHTTV